MLHTYFNIPKIEELTVKGLEGLTYIDKMRDQKEYSGKIGLPLGSSNQLEWQVMLVYLRWHGAEDRKEITISEETDRIYRTAPNTVELYSKDDKVC